MTNQQPLYAAVFLDDASQKQLLAAVSPAYQIRSADYMTLAFRPSLSDLQTLPWGAVADLQVVAVTTSSTVQVSRT